MKKRPTQARAKATVKAIVDATALILEKDGYNALTTNEVAEVAGVSIGSLYEYFPGKEAIIAALVKEMVDDGLLVMQTALDQSDTESFDTAMRAWVETLFGIVNNHKKLVRVLIFQIPYLMQIPAVHKVQAELLKIVLTGASRSEQQFQIKVKPEVLYLISSLAGSTLFSLALAPPVGMSTDAILDELSSKIIDWLTVSEP